MTHLRVEEVGVELQVAVECRRTKTSSSDGQVTHTFFPVDEAVVVAASRVEIPTGASVTDLAASLRRSYEETGGFVRGALVDLDIKGAKEASGMSFMWSRENGSPQHSKVLVATPDRRHAVVVHAVCPATAGDAGEADLVALITTARLVPIPGVGAMKGGVDD